MKYLIVKDDHNNEFGIVFPDVVVHRDVARVHTVRPGGVCVVSAGFCDLHHPITVWGRSESMNRDSRPEDAAVLTKDFGLTNC